MPKDKKKELKDAKDAKDAADWEIQENAHALATMTEVLRIADRRTPIDILSRQTTSCDNQTGNDCTRYCFARYIAKLICSQLNIINCNDKNEVRKLMQTYFKDIHQLEESTIHNSYLKLVLYSNGHLRDIDVYYNTQSPYPLNKEMVTDLRDEIDKCIAFEKKENAYDEINNQDGSKTVMFTRRNIAIYLMLQDQFGDDAIYLLQRLCENYGKDASNPPLLDQPTIDSHRADANRIMEDEDAYYKNKLIKPSAILNIKIKNGKFFRGKVSIPGHAVNVVGIRYYIDATTGEMVITHVLIRGSWLNCDGVKGYTEVPIKFVNNHIYQIVVTEYVDAMDENGAGITKRRNKKHNKSKLPRKHNKTKKIYRKPRKL